MVRLSLQLLVLTLTSQHLCAQSATTFSDHVLWERDFPNVSGLGIEAAAADHRDNLWAISRYQDSERLLCINSNGEMISNAELPQTIKPVFPAERSSFTLAVSSSGVVALLVRYMHGGQNVHFDGAKFAVIHSDGSLGPVRKVAGAGPDYKRLVALTDNSFLVLGDQSPMVIIRISSDGGVLWRRTFTRNWVFPSGAAFDNGSSCIVSGEYKRALQHVIWIDKLGVVRHHRQFAARRSQAASVRGLCTVLYDREPGLRHGEFFLTSFNRRFNQVWTTLVLDSAPQGGEYDIATVADGYVVAIGIKDSSFLAKYDFTGQLLWSATDTPQPYTQLVAASGNSFYLIEVEPKSRYSLRIVRAH